MESEPVIWVSDKVKNFMDFTVKSFNKKLVHPTKINKQKWDLHYLINLYGNSSANEAKRLYLTQYYGDRPFDLIPLSCKWFFDDTRSVKVLCSWCIKEFPKDILFLFTTVW